MRALDRNSLDKRLLTLKKRGASWRAIRSELGMSEMQQWTRLKRLGYRFRHVNWQINDNDVHVGRKLLAQGYTFSAVRKQTGWTYTKLCRIRAALGIHPEVSTLPMQVKEGVLRLTDDNYTTGEIAKRFNLSTKQVQWICDEAGKRRTSGPRIRKATINTILELRKKQMTPGEISRHTEATVAQVVTTLRLNRLSAKPASEKV